MKEIIDNITMKEFIELVNYDDNLIEELQHLQEELMDAVNYIEKVRSILPKNIEVNEPEEI